MIPVSHPRSGLVFKPQLTNRFKCYVDADWAGTWLKTRRNDKTGALSRMGYLITYANCPIMWGSKMQSLVALSTMEAELIAMSTALREVIHLQNLLLELRGCIFPIPFTEPQEVCCTFEDNGTCIEVAQSDHKIHPRTKDISVCLFHFCDHIEKGSLQLSMSRQNISSLIFLQNLCSVTNTCIVQSGETEEATPTHLTKVYKSLFYGTEDTSAFDQVLSINWQMNAMLLTQVPCPITSASYPGSKLLALLDHTFAEYLFLPN